MSTPTPDQCNALAVELEKVFAGKASLAALLDSPGLHSDALSSCFHGLQHYLADDDIRTKDVWYREMQEKEFRLLIHLLRSGANPRQISRIDFLSPTSEPDRQ